MSSRKQYFKNYKLAKKLQISTSEINPKVARILSSKEATYLSLTKVFNFIEQIKSKGLPHLHNFDSIMENLPEYMSEQSKKFETLQQENETLKAKNKQLNRMLDEAYGSDKPQTDTEGNQVDSDDISAVLKGFLNT